MAGLVLVWWPVFGGLVCGGYMYGYGAGLIFIPSYLPYASPSLHQNNSPKWPTLYFFKLHTWRHPGRANMHNMQTKMIHMYTTWQFSVSLLPWSMFPSDRPPWFAGLSTKKWIGHELMPGNDPTVVGVSGPKLIKIISRAKKQILLLRVIYKWMVWFPQMSIITQLRAGMLSHKFKLQV